MSPDTLPGRGPASPPPRPRRSFTLRLVGLAATATLGLAACGGGGSPSPASPPPPPAPPQAGALSASQPGELLAYVRERVRMRSAAGSVWAGAGVVTQLPGVVFVTTTAAGEAVARSGTPVQEAGVDEEDFLKTDGTRFAALTARPGHRIGEPAATLQLATRQPNGQLQDAARVGVLTDPELALSVHGLLMHAPASRLAVVGQSMRVTMLEMCGAVRCDAGIGWGPSIIESAVHVELMDMNNLAAPVLQQRLQIDGRLLGTRQVGSQVYLVTQHSPTLPVDLLPASAGQAERDAALAAMRVEDVLPKVRVDRGPAQPLVRDTDCWVQPANASPGVEITVVTVIDLGTTALTRRSRCFAGGAEALYLSSQALVLATTRWAPLAIEAGPPPAQGGVVSLIAPAAIVRPQDMRTDLHKFALAGGDIDYRGSGEVEGHLGWDTRQSAYRLSEHEGHLRVLTFTGQTGWFCPGEVCIAAEEGWPAASPARLTVLREAPGRRALEVVATLPNAQRPEPLGKPGEQVYAVRFLGSRGYVVTFRQTDPLYVLDLADPAQPRVLGELEIPGFSRYLFPMPDGQLLGVGRDADDQGRLGGIRVALFDVRQPSAPRELASHTWGGSGSVSGLDLGPHGIDLLTRGSTTRMALPALISNDVRPHAVLRRGLLRLEIDHASGRMTAKPEIDSASQDLWGDLAHERSVQVGDWIYYLSGGTLRGLPW